MRIKNLLFGAAAAMMMVTGCELPVDLGPEKIEISTATPLEIPVDGGTVTLEFTATVDWELQGYTNEISAWLNASAVSGKASADVQKIEFTANKNEDTARKADLSIFGNVLTKASFTVNQNGGSKEDGTLENPYKASTALQMIIDAKHDETAVVYVKGIVSEVGEVSTQYGNATYAISDDGTATNQLDVYRGFYIDGAKFTAADQIKIGDEVVVFGNLVNFKNNTPQFTQGSKIYSLNGKTEAENGGGSGSGTVETPEKPAEYTTEKPTPTKVTIAEFIEKEFSYTDWYELTGEIISLDEDNEYGNFTIKDETGSVYIYGMTSEWVGDKNDQSFKSLGLKVSDVVTLGTLRQHNPYTGAVQGGGNWMGAYYISHVEGEGPAPIPEGSVILTFPDDNSANNGLSSAQYETEWTAKIGDYSWKIFAFNNNNWTNSWTYIRGGRNGKASVATIATATALPKTSAVRISFNQIDASLVNSLTLTVYSDSALSTKVGEDIAVPASSLTAGDVNIDIPAASQAANQYYKLTFDLKAGSGNGFVRITKVAYLAAE